MRRLTVLPCPEPFETASEGDGRFCERCQLHVTELGKLDGEGLDALLATASSGQRVCARFELDGDRPRTKLGLALGLSVTVLAGCATPGTAVSAEHAEVADADAAIYGIVRDHVGFPVANAIVIIQGAESGLRKQLTNQRGLYRFKQLPADNYTIQVIRSRQSPAQFATVTEGGEFRADFELERELVDGMVMVIPDTRPRLDVTSPSSTYSSRMLEYD